MKLIRKFPLLSGFLLVLSLISVLVVGLMGLAQSWGKEFNDTEERIDFNDYISSTYLLSEKQKTGRWPHDLTGLPRFLAEGKKAAEWESKAARWETDEGANLQRYLRFYYEHSCSLSVVTEDQSSVTYFLHTGEKSEHERPVTVTVRD